MILLARECNRHCESRLTRGGLDIFPLCLLFLPFYRQLFPLCSTDSFSLFVPLTDKQSTQNTMRERNGHESVGQRNQALADKFVHSSRQRVFDTLIISLLT